MAIAESAFRSGAIQFTDFDSFSQHGLEGGPLAAGHDPGNENPFRACFSPADAEMLAVEAPGANDGQRLVASCLFCRAQQHTCFISIES